MGSKQNKCSRCGEPSPAGHRFCWSCGAALGSEQELKQVTVLLADLCDSTARVLASGTEDGHAFLERAYDVMAEAVTHFGGTRIQWRGDELLALFGAPRAQEDHAASACRAALRMLKRMGEAADAAPAMAVRIGIDSGEVIVGPGGQDLGARYSADGSPIHLASRLERLALPGTALVSATTLRLTDGSIETVPIGERRLRGFDKPVQVFQLVEAAAGAAPARRGHLAPLVGRDAVLATLEAELATARRGALRLVGLRGDAGIGKTRVLDEIRARLQARGARVVGLSARHHTSDIPYRVAADLVRALLPGVPAERAERPVFLDLLDGGDPGDAWRALSPTQRRRQIVEAIVALIDEVTRAGPLVLTIDDVFLSDGDSLRLLESLGRPLAARPLLLIVTYRTEFVHRWGDNPAFIERALTPLPTAEMADLVHELVGDSRSLAEVRAALLDRADGNPFFLEQLVLMLADQGSLAGRIGAYELAAEPADLGVPASVVATIAAQVDRLEPDAKRVLEAGAVAGDPLEAGLLAAMLGIEQGQVAAHVRSAVSAGLLDAARGPGGVLLFRHALVRETIYNALPRRRRGELHRLAYVALRARCGGQLGDAAALLAKHAHLGGEWAGAAECALAALARSSARSANRDALRLFERGLEAAGRVEPEPARLGAELALRMAVLGPMMALGQLDGIVANLERAEAITQALGDTRRRAAVALQLAVSLWTRGSYRQGLEAASAANHAARQSDSRSLQMAGLQARMMLNHGLGRYADAADDAALVETAFGAELAARRLMPGWAVVAIVNLRAFQADLLAGEGRPAEAQARLDEAYRELAAQEHAFSRAMVDFVQGGLWMTTGRAGEAADLLRSAHELCRAQDVTTMLPPILARLAGALAQDGRAAQALQLLEPAIEQKLFLAGGRYNDFYFPYYHALALLAAARPDAAAAAAETAWQATLRYEQNGHGAQARWLLARIAAERGQAAAARDHLEAARTLALQCHMPWLAQQVALATAAGEPHAA